MKKKYECEDFVEDKGKGEHHLIHECACDHCDSNIFQIMLSKSDDSPKYNCHDEHKLCREKVKGIDLCKKKEKLNKI